MPIKREPLFFTKKEAANRLIALKAHLNIKERIVLSWHSSVWYPEYNPMAPETALNSRIKLQLDDFLPVALEAQLTEAIQFEALKFVLDESNSVPYRFVDKEEKIPVGRFVDIKFYRWKSPETTKIVSVWLGTWEIAPRYSYRLFNSIGVVQRNYQALTSYAHLL
jgi:hypothetical protein